MNAVNTENPTNKVNWSIWAHEGKKNHFSQTCIRCCMQRFRFVKIFCWKTFENRCTFWQAIQIFCEYSWHLRLWVFSFGVRGILWRACVRVFWQLMQHVIENTQHWGQNSAAVGACLLQWSQCFSCCLSSWPAGVTVSLVNAYPTACRLQSSSSFILFRFKWISNAEFG